MVVAPADYNRHRKSFHKDSSIRASKAKLHLAGLKDCRVESGTLGALIPCLLFGDGERVPGTRGAAE